jgi:hypothetical protein
VSLLGPRPFARIRINPDVQSGSYVLAIGPMAIRVDPPHANGWPCRGAAESDLCRKFDDHVGNALRAYVEPHFEIVNGLTLTSTHPLAHWLTVRVEGMGISVEML